MSSTNSIEQPSRISYASPPMTPTATTTPTKSPAKQLPGKIVKKVKSVLHHVVHPHHHKIRTPSFSVNSATSPVFYPINVVRAYLPPDQSSPTGSVHSHDTLDDKYAKEIDSIDEPLADHSIDLSTSVPLITHIDMSDEHHLPQEKPQLNPHDQDTSTSGPTATEPETLGHHLVDPSMSLVDSSTTAIDTSDEQHLPQEETQLNLPEQDPSTSDPAVTSPIESEIPDHHSIDLSKSSNTQIDMSHEHDLPQEEPLYEQDTSASDPTATNSIESETPDPTVIGDNEEENLHPKEAEDKASSDATSEQVVSPLQTVPLELPSLSEAEKGASSDSNTQQVVSPSQAIPLELPSPPEAKEEASSEAISERVVSPSQTVPLDLSSSPEAKEQEASSQQVVSPLQTVPLDITTSPEAKGEASAGNSQQVVSSLQAAPSPLSSPRTKEEASSDATSERGVSPSQAVPLDLRSSPEASIHESQTPLPNLPKDIPSPSKGEESFIPGSYIPGRMVPSMFLPIPTIRRSFSSNLLTWWLPVAPLSLAPIPQYFTLIRRILTGRRLLLLLLLWLLRDSTAPFAAVETLALFAAI